MRSGEAVSLLIVEDDDVDRETIIRGLRRAKIANPVSTATDGMAALELLRNPVDGVARPRIVILDWNLPRMNGHEFLVELREDPALRDTTVFVLTTSADARDIDDAYNHHVAGYIVKSRIGPDFMRLIELLDSYWRIVELPTG